MTKRASNQSGDYRNPITANFETFTPDALGFFEAVCLAGYENQWMVVPVKFQREFFKGSPFGKQRIKVNGENGMVTVVRTSGFGRDWEEQRVFWSQADQVWISADGYKFTGGRINR